MGSKQRLNSRAFSLLELIIAIAILSIGITTILQAFSFCARAAGISCDVINAVFLSKDRLQELEFKERLRQLSQEPRETKGKQNKFSWVQTLDVDPESGLYNLNLTIHWERSKKKEALTTTTCLNK